jgi:hypothetical protein
MLPFGSPWSREPWKHCCRASVPCQRGEGGRERSGAAADKRGGERTEQVVSGFECELAILTVLLASLCSIQLKLRVGSRRRAAA